MLQPIQVSERELEEFIVENPDAIEEASGASRWLVWEA
jgi:hypothetical protein